MCNIGMSPMEAIVAATKIASECLGIEKETGTIEEGKVADLLIVEKNPIKNIASVADKNNIKVIFQQGKNN